MYFYFTLDVKLNYCYVSRSTLRLAEALKIMDNKDETFNVGFWTYDAKRKTGGELIVFKNCRKAGVSDSEGNKGFISLVNKENSHHPVKVRTWLIDSVNNCTVIL